jgi:hypothetical protein
MNERSALEERGKFTLSFLPVNSSVMALIVHVFLRDVLDDVFMLSTNVTVATSPHGTEFHSMLQKYIGCCLERATHSRGIAIHNQAVRAKPWWEKFRNQILEARGPRHLSVGESVVCFPGGYCAVALVATSSSFKVRFDGEVDVAEAGGWEETQRQRREAAHNSMIDLTVDLGSPVSVSSFR